MALLDDELQALYGLRPQDFVRARNDLVRALRKQGRRDDGDLAAKLRRPSVTAAALNHVAREEPQLLDALLGESSRLRDAMQRAVQGNAADVRPAQAAERRATEAVVTAARRWLEQLGQRDTDLAAQRISNTLRAVALDGSLVQRLQRGILETDEVASGFGFGGIDFDEDGPQPAPRKKTARRDAMRAEATQLAAEADRLDGVAENAQRQAEQLREQAALLHDRLRDADKDARRARHEADRARAAAARAHERADAAPEDSADAQTR